MHRNFHQTVRRTLAATFMAAMAASLLPAQPAEAGMGTGRRPPPPPPPRDVAFRCFEASEDLSIQGKGYAGVTVFHARSSLTGATSTTTTTNGQFMYRIRQGDAIAHRAMLFGVSSGNTSGDIVISSNARLEIKVATGEADFDNIADASKGIISNWKMGIKVLRGVAGEASAPVTEVSLRAPDMGARSFGVQFIARHLDATPLGALSTQPKVTYQVHSLEGFDATGASRLRWNDEVKNGEIQLAPGESRALTLKKFIATAGK